MFKIVLVKTSVGVSRFNCKHPPPVGPKHSESNQVRRYEPAGGAMGASDPDGHVACGVYVLLAESRLSPCSPRSSH
jgi:hypothetical protein